MQNRIEELEEDEEPLSEGEYEEGLDDDYDDEEEEGYDEGADVVDEFSGEEDEEGGPGFIRGLEPLSMPGRGQQGQQSKRQTEPTTKPWQGLESLPAATREKYVKLLGQLRDKNKQEITVLVLGKYFTGKSLTVNSLLNEDAANHSFLQRDQASLVVHSREAHGFKLNVIDAAGLNEADAISEARLSDIVDCVRKQPVDVLLYVDRFDLYRPDGSDEQILRAISRTLGAQVWKNAILGLSYAGESVNGYEWDSFSKQRAERLQQVVRRHGQCPNADLPVAFIDNSRSCPQNSDGEKMLPDKSAWLPTLMQKVADTATSQPAFQFDQKAVDKAANPNKKLRWLIPVVFAAQIAFKVFVFDRMIEDDKNTGDKHGPFSPSLIRAYRSRAALEKEYKKKRAQRKPVQSAVTYYDSDSD